MNKRHLPLIILQGGSFKTKVLAGPLSSEGLVFLGSSFPLCPSPAAKDRLPWNSYIGLLTPFTKALWLSHLTGVSNP